jgi:hypothetical protein
MPASVSSNNVEISMWQGQYVRVRSWHLRHHARHFGLKLGHMYILTQWPIAANAVGVPRIKVMIAPVDHPLLDVSVSTVVWGWDVIVSMSDRGVARAKTMVTEKNRTRNNRKEAIRSDCEVWLVEKYRPTSKEAMRLLLWCWRWVNVV